MPPRVSEVPRPFELNVDPQRKLLRAEFHRVVTEKDMRTEMARLADAVTKTGQGFTLLTDLTDLESMDIDCVPHVTRMMDVCLAAGVRQVVRIIPDPDKDIGFSLLSMTHYRGRVPISTFATRDDAEKSLGARR